MNVSAVFIRRPVATILLSVALTLAGIFAYAQLPVSALPQVDFPTVSVTAQLQGASPDTMATAVATPLIKQFSTIPAIQQISTTSSQGATSITIEFELSRDIDQAAADVQAAIARTQRQLPIEMTTPPSYRKLNPADAPILLLALQSETTPLPDLDAFGQQVISPALSTIDGVGQVQIFGSQKYAVRIQLDPDLLAARGIGVDEIQNAVAAANANTPVGTVQGPSQNLTIEAQTGLADAAGFRDLIVATRNDHPVRLGEVARVIDSVENNEQASWYDGERALVLAVQRQPGANTVAVVDRVKAMLPQLTAELGPTGSIHILNDRSASVRAAVHDVQLTLLVTVGLVVLVIYLFLGRLSATAIPTIAVPVSIITTFGAMQLLGYSIDNISLLALTLSVGLVVDDAIVMLENIVRHIDEGMPPMQAALKGSGEIGFTIVSITVSLVAVFIPVLLMGGVVGRVFHEFAMVVTIAIAASAFVSLTLTPMLCARLPAHAGPQQRNLFERAFDHVQKAYGRALDLSLRARPLMLLLFVATIGLTVWLFRDIPKGFFPQEDIGQLSIQTETRQDVSFPAMQALQQEAEAVIRRSPHVAHVASIVGGSTGGGANTLNNGRFFVELKPTDQRAPLPQVVADLRRDLSHIAGIGSFIVPVQNFSFGGRSSKSQYQFVVQGIDRDELYEWATRLGDRMGRDSAFADVSSDLQNTALQARIVVDRDKARSLGITADQLRSTLYTGFGSRQASTIYATGDNYAVIVEFDPRIPWSADRLDDVRVAASSGRVVPLSAFARVERVAGPLAINQLGQLSAVTISFNLPQGVALGDAVKRIDGDQERARRAGHDQHHLLRYRPRLPGGAGQPGPAAAGGGGDDLHRAGRSLRELHPPADHPHRPARSGGGGTGCVDRVRPGSQRDRHHRPLDADRHRQEERDHDGRRGAGSAARGLGATGGDPRGLPAALQTYHDDDPGGPHGHAADRDRPWRQRRAAPALGSGGRRRPVGVAAADTVHHARPLHLHGGLGGRPAPAVPASAARDRRGRRLAAEYWLQPHADMLDAGLVERLAVELEAEAQVERRSPGLRIEHSSANAGGSDLAQRLVHQQPAEAEAAGFAQHRHALDLGRCRRHHPPAQRADGAAVDERQEMRGRRLVLVDLLVERHALLVDEHRRADRQAGCPLGCIGSFPNERVRHGPRRSKFSRMGWVNARPPSTGSPRLANSRSSSGSTCARPAARPGLAATKRARTDGQSGSTI